MERARNFECEWSGHPENPCSELVPLERRASRTRRNERKAFWVPDGLDGQIHIQQWPIQVVLAGPFDGGQLLDGGLTEPGELGERQEKLLIAEKQPKTVFRDVGDFKRQSVCARHRRSLQGGEQRHALRRPIPAPRSRPRRPHPVIRPMQPPGNPLQ